MLRCSRLRVCERERECECYCVSVCVVISSTSFVNSTETRHIYFSRVCIMYGYAVVGCFCHFYRFQSDKISAHFYGYYVIYI